jgi:hypothetical protein
VCRGQFAWPFAFWIFINNIGGAVTHLEIINKFADDIKIEQTMLTQEDRGAMQSALNSLCE